MEFKKKNNLIENGEKPHRHTLRGTRHAGRPIVVNNLKIFMSDTGSNMDDQAEHTNIFRNPSCRRRLINRKERKLFAKDHPHFGHSHMSPQDERSRLEAKEKWLQERLAAVQNRLKAN